MSDLYVAPPIFQWLRNNLKHYHFRTEEAQQLRSRIRECDPATAQGSAEYLELYFEFSDMLERNPFSGQDRDGKDAAIIADGPGYLFYPDPQDHQIYKPLNILFRMGIPTAESRNTLQERLFNSLEEWSKQTELGLFRRREQFRSGRERILEEYGSLLDKGISTQRFFIRVMILLMLCILTLGFGAAGMITQRERIFVQPLSLAAISIGFATGLAILFVIKSILWIRSEKQRAKLVETWKRFGQNAQNEEADSGNGFRDPRKLEQIFLAAFDRAKSGHPGDLEEADGLAEAPEKTINYDEYLDPKGKNVKLCNTVRPIHLLVMLLSLCTICCALPLPVRPLNTLKQKMHDWGEKEGIYARIDTVYAGIGATELPDEVKASMTVSDDALLRSRRSRDADIICEVRPGDLLYPAGAEYEDGIPWLDVFLADGTRGFIEADACSFDDAETFRPDKIEILRGMASDRGVVTSGEGNVLTDGKVTEALMLEEGDTIRFTYRIGCRFNNMILAGALKNENGENMPSVTKAKVVFGGTKEYYINMDSSQDMPGSIISIPDEAALNVKIVIEETKGHEPAAVSEILLRGTRSR